MYNYCAVIPSLDPDERILSIAGKLSDKGFGKIIAVNDGSRSDELFIRLREEYGCDVLTHCVNFGKGRGMKTAMNHYMNEYSASMDGVVFVDSDDQHHIDDVRLLRVPVRESRLSGAWLAGLFRPQRPSEKPLRQQDYLPLFQAFLRSFNKRYPDRSPRHGQRHHTKACDHRRRTVRL